ncbi:efflux RND transporter permease subunit [Sansalvadorimonas sp. 2012CJ34-2]|uniref:Efflux RND transporter permease subunit n=1 Tax=Parendozoicomonas callyspongiae TaxID=2942213 RepID=A0ABT0PHH8_9GAMM|nr:efflux RND transporter permease subunit [Sansalvadorimonas sp. 2012CJ34-2]MCL6270461.1 efflux RND transporter permease subunit [Sansalvadorimonas sp. 2012CJ34-2]
MKLPRLAINNFQFTLVVILLLISLGVVSIMTMPRSEDPQFDFPAAMVRVVYPGTNPLDMEKLVLDPLEEAINELDDIKELKGEVEDGMAVVRVEFLFGSDPDEKYDDVVSEVTRIREQLPAGIQVLSVQKMSPADVNILQVALMSETASYQELKERAESLEKKLERVVGVKRADVEAYPQQQIHIRADLLKMQAIQIGLEDLLNAIKASSVNLPGGHTLAGERRFTVRTSGDYRDLNQIRRTAVTSRNGQVIYVEDIATVSQGDALPSYQARHNGKRSVFISVVQRKGSNILAVLDQLDAAIEKFKESLPAGMSVDYVHDQGISVAKRLNNFMNSLLMGLLVVAAITLLTLGFRAAAVIVIVIPMSVVIALGWVDVAGFGLQQMSIVGLVIALGLLVDNAIVVTENVGRFLREGHDRRVAAIKGASQVGWAVVSGTLTTMLAFLPMLLLQTGAGTFIRSMPVTVVLTLLASLIIALSLSPLMASRIFSHNPVQPRALSFIDRLSDGPYTKALKVALNRPILVLLVSIGLFISSLSLLPMVGVSMFPKAEKPLVLINIDAPESSSFERTSQLTLQVEEIVKKYPVVSSVTANIGKGNPRIFYNEIPKRQVPSYAQLVVQLNSDIEQDRTELVTSLREKFDYFPGAIVTVKELLQGPPYEAPVVIRVLSDDLDKLKVWAATVAQQMTNIDGLVSIDNPLARKKIDLKVNIHREKAAMLGVPINAIDQAIRASLVGIEAGQFRGEDGDDYPILVKALGQKNPQVDDFQKMMVKSSSGALVALPHLTSIEMEDALARIQHHRTDRMSRVTADVAPGFQAEAVTNELIEVLDQQGWPEDVSYQIGGEQEKRKESFGGMGQVVLVALMGIFAVLVLQFKSFSQPAIIFAAIPFAMTGSILALLLTGHTFSFTALVGLTSLVGIVVNNSIILVDYANQLRHAGHDLTSSITESAKTRLLPIILTTLTTVGGLLPLTLGGSSMWAPMGWSIIGGLLVSTLLTLFVVPVLYLLFTRRVPVTRHG